MSRSKTFKWTLKIVSKSQGESLGMTTPKYSGLKDCRQEEEKSKCTETYSNVVQPQSKPTVPLAPEYGLLNRRARTQAKLSDHLITWKGSTEVMNSMQGDI
jgi:hypothetical protein